MERRYYMALYEMEVLFAGKQSVAFKPCSTCRGVLGRKDYKWNLIKLKMNIMRRP